MTICTAKQKCNVFTTQQPAGPPGQAVDQGIWKTRYHSPGTILNHAQSGLKISWIWTLILRYHMTIASVVDPFGEAG